MELEVGQFENLCRIQCTIKEIADWFNCSEDDVRDWVQKTYNEDFETVYEKKSVAGKISLRRAQFKLAEKNAGMAMWLGKQYLNQSDDSQAINPQITSLTDIRKKLKMVE